MSVAHQGHFSLHLLMAERPSRSVPPAGLHGWRALQQHLACTTVAVILNISSSRKRVTMLSTASMFMMLLIGLAALVGVFQLLLLSKHQGKQLSSSPSQLSFGLSSFMEQTSTAKPWIPPQRRDPPEWMEIEERLVRTACNRTVDWCGPDGASCGNDTTTSAYDQHERLRRLILSGEHIKAVVFGNSVARSRNFASTRFLFNAIKSVIGSNVTTNYGRVKGGFELRHLLTCGGFAERMEGNNLALLQFDHYNAFELETTLRLLLQLPSKPAIVMISHCAMGDFSTRQDWREHKNVHKIVEPFGFWEEMRANETRIAEYYGVPYVRTCPAFFTMFNRTENDPFKRLESADRLIKTFIGDLVHYNEDGCGLQSCFLARLAVLRLPQHEMRPKLKDDGRLPDPIIKPPSDDGDANALSKFCMSVTDRDFKPVSSRGWSQERGGAGGRKTWYAAKGGYNSTLTMQAPFADFLILLIYTHPDLPLGRVLVKVWSLDDAGQRVSSPNVNSSPEEYYIDPCCEGTSCPGTGEGRGIYKEFRVPEQGYLQQSANVTQFEIELVIVPRTEPTKCSNDGTDFSFVSVTGLSATN